jgi:hypothetical protein
MKKLFCIVIFAILCISCPEPMGATEEIRLFIEKPVTGEMVEIPLLCSTLDIALEKIGKWGAEIQHMAEQCGFPDQNPECLAEWISYKQLSVAWHYLVEARQNADCVSH